MHGQVKMMVMVRVAIRGHLLLLLLSMVEGAAGVAAGVGCRVTVTWQLPVITTGCAVGAKAAAGAEQLAGLTSAAAAAERAMTSHKLLQSQQHQGAGGMTAAVPHLLLLLVVIVDHQQMMWQV
jgi:hypothetical protein